MKKYKLIITSIICCLIFVVCFVIGKYETEDDTDISNIGNISENAPDMFSLQDEFNVYISDIDLLSDSEVEVYCRSETDVYRAYFSESEKQIAVEHSSDDGDTWTKTLIPYLDYGYGANTVFLSFVDENTGYLLYCGEPASGLMNEVLFKTEDGGKSFVEVTDISNQISDYPNDMEFLTEDIGFITMTYHGNGPVYYQTNDGGQTWVRQSIELPETEFAYAQGDRISRNSNGQVEIIIELVLHPEGSRYVTYYTDDGIAWRECVN